MLTYAKQFANDELATQTPAEVLKAAVRDGEVELKELSEWIDVDPRTLRYWLFEGRGAPTVMHLELIRAKLRRYNKHGLALKLARAELPDYLVCGEVDRPDAKECDVDRNGVVDGRDGQATTIQLMKEATVTLEAAHANDVNAMQASAEKMRQALRLLDGQLYFIQEKTARGRH